MGATALSSARTSSTESTCGRSCAALGRAQPGRRVDLDQLFAHEVAVQAAQAGRRGARRVAVAPAPPGPAKYASTSASPAVSTPAPRSAGRPDNAPGRARTRSTVFGLRPRSKRRWSRYSATTGSGSDGGDASAAASGAWPAPPGRAHQRVRQLVGLARALQGRSTRSANARRSKPTPRFTRRQTRSVEDVGVGAAAGADEDGVHARYRPARRRPGAPARRPREVEADEVLLDRDRRHRPPSRPPPRWRPRSCAPPAPRACRGRGCGPRPRCGSARAPCWSRCRRSMRPMFAVVSSSMRPSVHRRDRPRRRRRSRCGPSPARCRRARRGRGTRR